MAKPEICKKCTHENVPESGFPCHLCGYLVGADKSQIGAFKKKQTNADRIRNMTDEELAKILFGSCLEVMGREQCNSFHNEGCEKCVVQWLKSEVKE